MTVYMCIYTYCIHMYMYVHINIFHVCAYVNTIYTDVNIYIYLSIKYNIHLLFTANARKLLGILNRAMTVLDFHFLKDHVGRRKKVN